MADNTPTPKAILCTDKRIKYRKETVPQGDSTRPMLWWEVIEKKMTTPIANVDELITTMFELQPRKSNFESNQLKGLKYFFNKFASTSEKETIFNTILPGMQKLVRNLSF